MGGIRVLSYQISLGTLAFVLFSFVHQTITANAGAPIVNSLEARAEVVADGLGNVPVVDTSGDPVVASNSITNGGVTSTASAEATYGVLKAFAEITKDPNVEPFNFATGTAQFIDTLTISGGAGTADVNFEFQLDGMLEDINAGESRAQVELNIFLPETSQSYNETFFVESGNSRVLDELIATSNFIFDYDVPFAVEVRLVASVQLEETDNGSATSDFFNTSVLTGLTVSSGGVPVNGVTVSASSGTSYPIPEPSSVLLMLAGVSVVAFRNRT